MRRLISFCFVATVLGAGTTRYVTAPVPGAQIDLYVEETGLLSGPDRYTGNVDMTGGQGA